MAQHIMEIGSKEGCKVSENINGIMETFTKEIIQVGKEMAKEKCFSKNKTCNMMEFGNKDLLKKNPSYVNQLICLPKEVSNH